ncbi:lytic transglycosylase domain-containing protein [Streptomyces montanisoli]|uniref:Lytic transglycosylase domain-containing protein n=1 Tax=Streptomyces montanisoli TaxID=2798581 RepID=A0A940MCL3_9ACTN|nr:lytic transglycosylase domain-containing protein [Streptomyces montanisoli]MBP0460514.1 lytic transglycosylase domain-containing protein [Streptomyces montanisoli]
MAALFGRRLRRGATSTAVAAVAIAALSASQAPGATSALSGGPSGSGGRQPAGDAQDRTPDTASGDSQYYKDLPPLNSPIPQPDSSTTATGSPASGIPATVLDAYKKAEASLRETSPQCRLPWQLLAAIGKVESGQARGGEVDSRGTTLRPILGPELDGHGFANIPDTDNGLYDQDKVHDRAVGPMQFIPGTWRTWQRDGNHDGVKDPNNIYDAALATGAKLCAGNQDMSVQADMNAAILSYNHSQKYLDTVLSWFEYYKKGTHQVPDGTGVLPSGSGPGSLDPTSPVTTVPPLPHVVTHTPSHHPSPSPSQDIPKSGHTASPSPDPGDSTKPSEPSTPPKDGGSTTPPDKQTLAKLEKKAGDGLSAIAGTEFGGHAEVRALDAKGKPMAGVRVTFLITGDTDARFDGGAATATATTGKDGTAGAPAVKAGDKLGDFAVRATAGAAPAVDFKAAVTVRTADTLVYLGKNGDQSAAPSAEFANPIAVKATRGGDAAGKVAVTATILTDKGAPAPAGAPSFTSKDLKPGPHEVKLTTAADGTLTLPKLVAGKDAGTYEVKLTAEGGGSVTVPVKVAAPTTPTDPPSGGSSGGSSDAPSGGASDAPSGGASASPSTSAK